MRTPEVVEVTSARLYVGNLSFDAGESDLFDLFNGVGSVQNVEIVVNRHNMRSKGFAFVQMQSVDEAKRAVSELHDKEFMSRKLVVSGAKALEERRSERTAQAAEYVSNILRPRVPSDHRDGAHRRREIRPRHCAGPPRWRRSRRCGCFSNLCRVADSYGTGD